MNNTTLYGDEIIHEVSITEPFTIPSQSTQRLVVIIANGSLLRAKLFEATPEASLQADQYFSHLFCANIGSQDCVEYALNQGFAGSMNKYYIAITTPE